MQETEILWQPSESFIQNSRLTEFAEWLQTQMDLQFDSYEDLWKWSVEHSADFWLAVWDFFEVKSETKFKTVIGKDPMPDTQWFAGASVNFAEQIFNKYRGDKPAIVFASERRPIAEISWKEMRDKVSRLRSYFISLGLKKGDRVVAFLPNIPEATYAFLAAASLGAVWSGCSPDFGVSSVVERFRQIEPKILIAVDGYQYGGKPYDKTSEVNEIIASIDSLEKVIIVPYLREDLSKKEFSKAVLWEHAMLIGTEPLEFERLDFNHPIWVLYSSGTTGQPKAITHSHGGILLEHLKYLAFHNDVHSGERFFWYSTTGWMMWNYVQGALLQGASIVLYDGSPGFPDLNVLWKFAGDAGIHHFGTSAPFLVACMKSDIHPGKTLRLDKLRSISSTGAPLPPEAFEWVYHNFPEDVWLCSMSGGTDVCTAFVGGCPWKPVYRGELQARALGCSLHAFNEEGKPVIGSLGEMVITKPMPSMPIYFWNDSGKKRYLESYFSQYPGIWRHGDWVEINERGGLVILGRSDATLNRHGVRIGTAEIYRTLIHVEEIADSLIVNLELPGGEHFMPLFILLKEGENLNDALKEKIVKTLRSRCSPRHVPDEIIQVPDIPYTISGKKMEEPVKKILLGMDPGKALNKDSMRNPDAIAFYQEFAEKRTLTKQAGD